MERESTFDHVMTLTCLLAAAALLGVGVFMLRLGTDDMVNLVVGGAMVATGGIGLLASWVESGRRRRLRQADAKRHHRTSEPAESNGTVHD